MRIHFLPLLALLLGACHAKSTSTSTTTTNSETTTTTAPTATTTTTATPINTTPVKCFPTHGSSSVDMILRQANPNVGQWCTNPEVKFLDATVPRAPKANNYITAGWTMSVNATQECAGLPTHDTQSKAYELCRGALEAIVSECPWNGGEVDNQCGRFWLQTCPLGRRCEVGDPEGRV